MELIPEGEFSDELTLLGSRFIALLFPLQKEGDLPGLLAQVEERYPKATHYCYAARAGVFERCNDDGEPPKSAGFPLLTLLRKKAIAFGLLVVVRYYGGTKLGLPRLKRTYADAALLCLMKAAFAEIVPGMEMELALDYPQFESLKKEFDRDKEDYEIEEYGEKVRLLWRGDAKLATAYLTRLPPSAVLRQRESPYKRSYRL
jgi:putative IMPACT (imprinted ancient) family translation regulator